METGGPVMNVIIRTMLIGCSLLIAGSAADGLFNSDLLTGKAQARIGRPLTPVSAAGVARRTTRRVIRRTAIYVSALPRNCSTVVIEGTRLHLCGGTYYQPYGNQFVVVNVD